MEKTTEKTTECSHPYGYYRHVGDDWGGFCPICELGYGKYEKKTEIDDVG